MIDQLQVALRQLDAANALKMAIGKALTTQQQMAVSAKIASGPNEFIKWASTDAGTASIRKLADDFTAGTLRPADAVKEPAPE